MKGFILLFSLLIILSSEMGHVRCHYLDYGMILDIMKMLNSQLEPQNTVAAQSNGDFKKDMLTAHNEYRSLHSAPEMVLDSDLNTSAQNWANELAKNNKMEHSDTKGRYGENIFQSYSTDPNAKLNAKVAVKAWYDEIKLYKYTNPFFSSKTGHFTQLIWKNSRKLGVGMAKNSKTNTIFAVAQYSPAGNMKGSFEENVLEKKIK